MEREADGGPKNGIIFGQDREVDGVQADSDSRCFDGPDVIGPVLEDTEVIGQIFEDSDVIGQIFEETDTEWQEALKQKLAGLPEQSGVYLYMDAVGKVIYVGKAKILKNRVRSYFQQRDDKGAKTELLVSNIRALDYIVTATETEALVLENTLIKQHKPHFNILLKDDKAYPWLRITLHEAFPRLDIVRKAQKDGARYFAAFTSATNLRGALDPVRRLFPVRTCRRDIRDKDGQRPCLYHHIGLCAAPCAGFISSEDYRAIVRDLCSFLDGKHEEVMETLEAKMNGYAEALEFEKAAVLRDRIGHLRSLSRKQAVVSAKMEERDIIGLASDSFHHAASILSVRNGKLVGNRNLLLEGTGAFSPSEIMEAILMQYYRDDVVIPKEMLLEVAPESLDPVTEWLSEKRGSKVEIQVPQRGFKTELIDMAKKNAHEELEQYSRVALTRKNENQDALASLRRLLELPDAPEVVEAYDISNTGTSEMVASMVVFRDGMPDRSAYRRFRIRNQDVQDDYASMQQAVHRRFSRFLDGSSDEAFGRRPDLILADGGMGHVHAVEAVLKELGVQVPVWGMAKDDKHRSHRLVNDRGEVALSRHQDVLRLVASIQNEAHRFAITYNRTLRSKRQVKSALDDLPGIGPTRKKALLRAFGSVTGIRKAGLDELAAVEGFGEKRARALRDALDGKKSSMPVKKIAADRSAEGRAAADRSAEGRAAEDGIISRQTAPAPERNDTPG